MVMDEKADKPKTTVGVCVSTFVKCDTTGYFWTSQCLATETGILI